MRKPLIAGNWKMHGSRAMINDLLSSLKRAILVDAKAEMAIFPPFVFLQQTQQILSDSAIHWGAQNLASEKLGAFTGEVSADMLLEFGCHYGLIGHSERRSLYHETDAVIMKKFVLAKQSGLVPILCVGETLAERKANETYNVVSRQLNAILAQSVELLSGAVLAYEPVWAIGTGLTATPEQAQEVHLYLRQQVAKYNSTIADKLRILYGGSVKAANAQALFAMPDIDGGLIGGASLDANEFLQIYHTVS